MFLTSSEFAPIVVLPTSSVVGSPVLKLVLGSVFAGAGQARSIPVPPLFAVAVESWPTRLEFLRLSGLGHMVQTEAIAWLKARLFVIEPKIIQSGHFVVTHPRDWCVASFTTFVYQFALKPKPVSNRAAR